MYIGANFLSTTALKCRRDTVEHSNRIVLTNQGKAVPASPLQNLNQHFKKSSYAMCPKP